MGQILGLSSARTELCWALVVREERYICQYLTFMDARCNVSDQGGRRGLEHIRNALSIACPRRESILLARIQGSGRLPDCSLNWCMSLCPPVSVKCWYKVDTNRITSWLLLEILLLEGGAIVGGVFPKKQSRFRSR